MIDTLRADAVSAYGAVEGTTPSFDALASRGLLYERAYAPSPWTLPSHASLLTGFEVDRHGVGVAGRMGLRAEFTTLAERLSEAGYQTVGFSENPLVSDLFGFDQGFERFSALTSRMRSTRTEPRKPSIRHRSRGGGLRRGARSQSPVFSLRQSIRPAFTLSEPGAEPISQP